MFMAVLAVVVRAWSAQASAHDRRGSVTCSTAVTLQRLGSATLTDHRATEQPDSPVLEMDMQAVSELQHQQRQDALHQFLGQVADILPLEQLAQVHNAFVNACQAEPGAHIERQLKQGVPQCYLALTHACAAQSCATSTCQLCENDPLRPCGAGKHLMDKYLQHEQLTARCGADISLQLCSCANDEPLPSLQQVPALQIQVHYSAVRMAPTFA